MNRLGIGKHSVTKSTWTGERPAAASLAAESCKCNLATSLDQLPDLRQGSLTATTSSSNPFFTRGSGSDGQAGTSLSSSSSIHSGYRTSQVVLASAYSRWTPENSAFGTARRQTPASVKLKLSKPILRLCSLPSTLRRALDTCCQSTPVSDTYRGSDDVFCQIHPTSTNLDLESDCWGCSLRSVGE
ncbi:hypothetical protein MUK42_30824 [Musa troglodytarum]|uniref:Uncharacterized protein n=1 Tax=Musa troglodytarum TaxID=320322 RepID=A0A9E7FFT8_9LILI|nr:hypothetical protein MUK42_30824 [Musa troglodytarum]